MSPCLQAGNERPDHFVPLADDSTQAALSESFEEIDALVLAAIEQGQMPGCVVLIGHQGRVVYERAFGHRQVEPRTEEMTIDTVFDLASLTKPIATATSVMMLVEEERIDLSQPLAEYLPGFEQNGKESITVTQLLIHQGGLIPDNALSDYLDGRELAVERMLALEPIYEPGTKFAYTDVGFIALGETVTALTELSIADFSRTRIFEPLGMSDTRYVPTDVMKARSAATEQRNGEWMKGEVHDPRAYEMDGVAGHAGLFSTANDLAIYAQMMLNGGSYRGTTVLSPETIEIMTAAYEIDRGTRGLGWDKQSPYSSNRGATMSTEAFGHGGFTGTAIWIDPGHELFVIFLGTRLHPDGEGTVNRLAGSIGTIATDACSELRLESAHSNQPVRGPTQPNSDAPQGSLSEPRPFDVLTGLDVLRQQGFDDLHDQRIGLLTNHTGIANNGVANVTLFAESEAVHLTALFSPEHGFEGQLDISRIDNSSDQETGLMIYSLYGETRRPTAEMLEQIDTMVFDIQDIGTRFYTYISTMGESMLACAEHGKRFVVLDRPNPIGGQIVSGPVLEDGLQSFVGFHTIPVRHGMTVGEIAMMLKDELHMDLDLTVIECDGWRRDWFFDRTGLLWVNPSPNMRSLTQAILYPGIGLLETTNLSVGRGTDTPFERFGAPWIDAKVLARSLNELGLPGVSFLPFQFTPESSVYADEICNGIQIAITDRESFLSVETGLKIAITLRELYPEDWNVERYGRLLSNSTVLESLIEGASFDELKSFYALETGRFRNRRDKYLLYAGSQAAVPTRPFSRSSVND